jgi:hypothetical protein
MSMLTLERATDIVSEMNGMLIEQAIGLTLCDYDVELDALANTIRKGGADVWYTCIDDPMGTYHLVQGDRLPTLDYILDLV